MAAESPRPLRVISFNLFHGGPYASWTGDTDEIDARLAMVAEDLRALDPDIVALHDRVRPATLPQPARPAHRPARRRRDPVGRPRGLQHAHERRSLPGDPRGPGGLIDAFRAAHPDAPGPTVYQRPGATVPTVSRRVDYIFVGGVARGRDAVCGSRVVLDRPRLTPDGRTVWPSDHYGVLADLDVFGIQCAP